MEYNLYLVDAFTNQAFKGNPACVIPEARGLSESQMQDIAKEINVSETVFVSLTDNESYKIRYFSPYKEVSFCGHSTVAIFYILALRGYINPIETGVRIMHIASNEGKIDVAIHFSNYQIENVMVKMGTPKITGRTSNIDPILKSLNLSMDDLSLKGNFNNIPIIELHSKFLFVPIKSKGILDNIELGELGKKELMGRLKELDAKGVHLYHLPEEHSKYVYTRNFSIMENIIEEPATGTANGCLVYLLKNENLLKRDTITAIQGEAMGRKSIINCVINENKGIYGVEVGGKGKVVMEGIIHVEN